MTSRCRLPRRSGTCRTSSPRRPPPARLGITRTTSSTSSRKIATFYGAARRRCGTRSSNPESGRQRLGEVAEHFAASGGFVVGGFAVAEQQAELREVGLRRRKLNLVADHGGIVEIPLVIVGVIERRHDRLRRVDALIDEHAADRQG